MRISVADLHALEQLVGMWACNVPFMSQTDHVAPDVQFADGSMHLWLFVGTTRLQVCAYHATLHSGSLLTRVPATSLHQALASLRNYWRALP